VSSPARLPPRGALAVAGVLAIEAGLYAWDDDLEAAAQRNDGEPVYRQIVDVGDFIEPVGYMAHTNPIYAGLWVAGYAFRVRPLREIPAQILESHLIAGGVRNVLKPLVGRKHPADGAGSR